MVHSDAKPYDIDSFILIISIYLTFWFIAMNLSDKWQIEYGYGNTIREPTELSFN